MRSDGVASRDENIAHALGKGIRKTDQRAADASHASRGVKVRNGCTCGAVLSSAADAVQHGVGLIAITHSCATWQIWPDEDLSDEARFCPLQ